MASALPLTIQEATLVRDVLQYWCDGMSDAKDATIKDSKTLDTIDKMLDATGGLDESERLLAGVIDRMDNLFEYSDV